ncbi:MAG: hypothetical protein ACOC01_04320, partial [Bacteroidales bacterium]
MKKTVLLTLVIGLIVNTGFSQKAENAKSALRINHNENGVARGEREYTQSNAFAKNKVQAEFSMSYEKDAIYANRKPENELVERRDRTSKHFINPDGSVEAFLSTGSINYQENGKWHTIERAITPNNTGKFENFEFANTKNAFKSFYGNTPVNGIKTIVENQEITEWQNKKIEFYDAEMNLISSIQSDHSEININHAKASYANVFPHTEAQITQLHDGRKIDYEITSAEFVNLIPENVVFLAISEDITLPDGWTAKYYVDKLSEDQKESKQRISIFNNRKEEILQYQPPVYFEKENRQGKEDPIGEYQISQNGQTLSIKTIVDANWIMDEERSFPLVIDPTVSVYPDNTTNWTRSAVSDGYDYQNTVLMGHDGYGITRSSIKYNTATIPAGSIVNSTTGYFYITEAYVAWGGQIRYSNSADPVTTSGITLYNSVTGDLSNIYSMTSPNNAWKTIALNSTGIEHVQSNIAGTVNLGIRPVGSWSSSQRYGAINHTGTNRPYLSINYTVPSGPPSCATLISPSDGASGTAHSGNLEWEAVGGADTYDVYFGTSPTPPQVATDQVATTYPIDCLLPETTYYWKVVPKNGDGSASGCATWSFTTDNKLHIYRNDWETASEGYFGTSGGTVDGWNTNNATASGSYNNRWAIGSGTNAINGKSAGLTALYNGSLSGSYFEYWWDMGELHRMIYRPFDMTEFRDIELNFDWKCGGESGQDYGEILTSINGGTNWLTDDQGGLSSDGKYWNSSSTIRSQTLTLPETRNNQSDFVLGFNFDDLSGNGSGTDPSFVVDNIVIKACPYEGYLSSPDQTEPFAWAPPTANTTTTITVNETHDCAYFEWEQSTDNGNTWTVIPGETNVSYTTPSDITSNTYYRCRVYFGSGCPGAYQSEPFKIVFEPECTSGIAPLDGAANQSTDVTISWNADPLATDYDIYFAEDNPPSTLLDNTASTSYDLTNLDYGTTYYWQVLPSNAGGTASGCDVWSFTTGAAPPQFHNYGGSEQLTFNNSAYKADAPMFRISHASTMDEVQIQISDDVTFPGTTVYDGTFTGSFSGENNFETSLSGDVLDNPEFPQPFDSDVLTNGATAPNDSWFAPNSNPPIAHATSGGNPGGRVGYSGAWNNYWSNFLRLPEVDATGMDEITLSFDVWHSYFDTHPNDKLYLSAYADGGYVDLPQTVKIDGATVTASANTGNDGYAFYFTEERDAANIEVTLDISGITDKSNILLYLNPSCAYNDNKDFYVYFDNISVTGADQEFTPGTTYYARARGKVGGSWTDWTSDTFSFTYKNQASIEWHQTAEPQLQTNTLSDVITLTESCNDFATIEETVPPANPFENHSFETSGDWNTYVTGGSELEITLSDGGNWQSDGSKAARMYMWGGYAMSSDVAIISQTVDLTDVEQITFDAYSHYGQNMSSSLANGGTLRLIIGGTSSNTAGTVYETINHCVSGSSSCSVESLDNAVTIDPADRGPNKLVKFVWTGFSSGDLGGALVSFQVDNIRVGDAPNPPGTADGTISSTTINLSSFYGDDSWDELSWDQTLNG